jgi:Tol biopolymer transport system component
VFSSGRLDRDLVVMQRNGSHRRVLTLSGRDDSDPSWSPDGRRIAFSVYDGRRLHVALLNLGSGRVQDLGDGFNPDWSPNGRRLVFVDAEGFDDLVTVDADGSNRRRLNLPSSVGIADNTDPAWSPDGKDIAFVGDGLWIVSADGRERRRLRPEGGPGTASWSRDGRVLAFDCATRQFHVCTVREDGTQFRGLTRKGRHPKWSPRGGLIATTRLDALKPGILLFRPDGKLVGALRNGSANPDWSPDAKWLVAERELPGGPRLYATDASHGSLTRVTQGRYRDSAASWSPDGRSIVFRRHAGGRCAIAVANAASRKVRTLVRHTVDPGCVDQPTWSPNGGLILFASRGDLWQVPTREGKPRRLTRTQSRERSPRFAPDGRSIGFVGQDGVLLLRPNGERTLLVAGAFDFSWSHDGRTLAYLLWDERTEEADLYIREGSDKPRKLFEAVEDAPSWSPDGSGLAFSYSTAGPAPTSVLAITDLSGNTTELVDDATQPDWRR